MEHALTTACTTSTWFSVTYHVSVTKIGRLSYLNAYVHVGLSYIPNFLYLSGEALSKDNVAQQRFYVQKTLLYIHQTLLKY